MTPLRVALIGMGKMGRAIAALAPERDAEIVAQLRSGDVINAASLSGAEVAIEFTTPRAADTNIRACMAASCPVVVGTTGWYAQLPSLTQEVERSGGAALVAPNFSIGIAIFDRVVTEAARLFRGAPGFEPLLIETHHSAKRDAPSGTAAAIAKSAEAAFGSSIPITSVRVGSVPGTHEIIFDAAFEQVRLVHEARDRRVFAEGALLAARWLAGRKGGKVYGMQDVISMLPSEEQR